MAPHPDLAPALIAAACAIGSAPAVLAQTVVEAKTWDDAISKFDCKDISKNADGSVRQFGEQSSDEGKTWVPSFDFTYRPSAAAAGR